ncbi:MAG: hypothetical protein U0R44_03110 [Candidatus Micrarchaeia archaeon]
MDRSYIIEAQMKEGAAEKPVIAVVFMNTEPGKGLLGDLGLHSVSAVTEVRPESRQPTEPTMYAYDRTSSPGCVLVTRFDWQGKVINTARIHGEPHSLIPPVSGQAAEDLLYLPQAYVISACVRDGPSLDPVVGVLFIKPAYGEKTLAPDKKSLSRMGLVNIQSVERVAVDSTITGTALYVFDRTPSASEVRVSSLNNDGTIGSTRVIEGQPHSIIPQIKGTAADRFVNPRNGLGKSDFPAKPASIPPSSRDSRIPPSQLPSGSRRA